MRERLRSHLTYANVISTLCLFLLLGGGSAVALSGTNTVQSDDLGPGAQVKAADVAANAVKGTNVTDNSLTGADVANLGGGDITDNSVTGGDVNEASLDATPLATRVAQGGCEPAVAGTGAMVKVGPVCIDKYEMSVWSSPTGGTQFGATFDNYPCNDNGQNCTNIYARSVPGVTPSAFLTYFQAQQALANSGKRLPTNAEWQTAVAGTPDTAACNVGPGSVANTGANGGCASNYGAYDMVGNLYEEVADWDEQAGGCDTWPGVDYGSDLSCIGRGSGEASTRLPVALIRGGSFANGTAAGPFLISGNAPITASSNTLGFRGAR